MVYVKISMQIQNQLHAIITNFKPISQNIPYVGCGANNSDQQNNIVIFPSAYVANIVHNLNCTSERAHKISLFLGDKDDKPIKILSAYHQFYAVNKAISSTIKAVSTNGKAGVFWHTQGSGKSLSMVFYSCYASRTA